MKRPKGQMIQTLDPIISSALCCDYFLPFEDVDPKSPMGHPESTPASRAVSTLVDNMVEGLMWGSVEPSRMDLDELKAAICACSARDAKSPGFEGYYPMRICSSAGNLEMLSMLANAGFPLEFMGVDGQECALSIVCARFGPDVGAMVRVLVEAGSDLRFECPQSGLQPLQKACAYLSIEAAGELAHFGLDMFESSNDYPSPREIAEQAIASFDAQDAWDPRWEVTRDRVDHFRSWLCELDLVRMNLGRNPSGIDAHKKKRL